MENTREIGAIYMAKAITAGKNGKLTFDFDVRTGTGKGMHDVRLLDPSTSTWSDRGTYSTNAQITRAVREKSEGCGNGRPTFYGI